MLRKYYIKEIITIALFCWIVIAATQVNAMTTKVADKIEELEDTIEELEGEITNLYSLIRELHEVIYNLKHDIEEFKGLDKLDFGKAFGQMRQEYGSHHLFEWRGRVFTTDIEEERNNNARY